MENYKEKVKVVPNLLIGDPHSRFQKIKQEVVRFMEREVTEDEIKLTVWARWN